MQKRGKAFLWLRCILLDNIVIGNAQLVEWKVWQLQGSCPVKAVDAGGFGVSLLEFVKRDVLLFFQF